MTREEIEKYKDPKDVRVTDNGGITDLYQFTFEELEQLVKSEIALREAARNEVNFSDLPIGFRIDFVKSPLPNRGTAMLILNTDDYDLIKPNRS